MPATRTVRAALQGTPVFAVHRVLTPDEAEGILADEAADAVTVVRALIADPEWPEKARAGRTDEIRHCTGCNQGCYGNLTAGLPITCVTNPVTGREAQLGGAAAGRRPRRSASSWSAAGPAGLEAAWVAAARGHDVTLLERSDELGGKIRLAAALPGRGELADFADWRAAECDAARRRRPARRRRHHRHGARARTGRGDRRDRRRARPRARRASGTRCRSAGRSPDG